MSDLVLHCGARDASMSDLNAVPIPEETNSYCPLPHALMVEMVEKAFSDQLGARMTQLQLGLNSKGAQLFGVASFDVDSGPDTALGQHGIAVGFRNSYNKTLKAGIAVGARVFVCDNLAFSGDAVTILRKHTTYLIPDLTRMLTSAAAEARVKYGDVSADFDAMGMAKLDDDRAFSFLGRCFGQGVLRSQQFTKAIEAWKVPTHAEFLDKDMWRLYNAGTEALKAANAMESFKRYTGFHAAVMGEVAALQAEEALAMVPLVDA